MNQGPKLTFVSAGAGSGKTYRLTQILHDELAAGRARPAGVIATTFTVKAATELRERVREDLYRRGEFALASAMGQARIGTINAVCGGLLERFAFEAGMASKQQVLEDAAAQAMLDRTIDTVREAGTLGAFLAIVRRLGLDDTWKGDLAQLVKEVRTNDIDPTRLAGFAEASADGLLLNFGGPAKDFAGKLRKMIDAALPAVSAAAQESGKGVTTGYLARLKRFLFGLINGGAPWGEWAALSKAAPEAALKPLTDPIAELAGRVDEHPGLHADVREYLSQMFALCTKALEAYSQTKRELGVVDFTDQEHLLLGLLDHPAVQDTLAEELDLLLVDEFQDTSPIQLALFLKLARLAKAVYWVGDVKQAIYGFRGSDTELMEAVVKSLPSLDGKKEILGFSYRSRQELVKIVNAVFTEAFAGNLSPDEVALQAKRQDVLPGAALANWVLGGKNISQEAAVLAVAIRRLVDERYPVLDRDSKTPRDVRYGDIAVLVRTNERVQQFALALSNAGIRTETARAGLMETPEATLALACLRRLNDPSDTIATAEIVSLCDCAPASTWVADRLRHLANGGDKNRWREIDAGGQRPHPVVSRLAQMRDRLPLLAPREALQAVITECNLASLVLAWTQDPEIARVRLANLEALVELASQYEDLSRSGRHAASISGLIIWFGELAADQLDMLAHPLIDAVKVLTHHAAKGLEWPVVVLADMNAEVKSRLWGVSARSSQVFDMLEPLAGRTLRYWPWPFGLQRKLSVADTVALTPLAAEWQEAAADEAKRLLYVSMTRARDLLVIARSSRNIEGDWISTVQAPWLLPDKGKSAITLPAGERIAATRWDIDPPEEVERPGSPDRGPLRWFPIPDHLDARLPLVFSPSSAEETAGAAMEKLRIGERIAVREGTDMEQLGKALHACIAVSFTDPNAAVTEEEVARILAGFGMEDAVSAHAVLRQVGALHDWIRKRWPGVTTLAEWPVQRVMTTTGQTLRGQMDLLMRASGGWILIDHKSSPTGADQWDRLAADYSGQLAAYADAVLAATGIRVRESWIFLPVAGGGIRVDPERGEGA